MEEIKTESELQATNERLSFHLESTDLGFIEWDNEFHLKVWSKRAEEIFGWTKKEFIDNQKTGYSQVYIGDQARVFNIAELLTEGRINRNRVQNRNYTKDGRVIWCEWFNSVLKDRDGKVITILSLVQDITAIKEIEEKLNRANHLYAFISQVNQKIVRVKDEEDLFRNACQIAIEFGKFKMAWIGLFDEASERIRLVEQSGMSAEDVKLFAHAPEQINSLQKSALSTGCHYVCNDIAHDFPFENRKPFMAERGYLSCMILPIKKSGKIMGTFNLYAPELNYFNKEEITMLMRATEDISFAIDLFEKEKKQRETEELLSHYAMRFRLMVEKSNDMKTLSGIDGRVLYSSPSVERVLGYSDDEYLKKYPHDIIHADDLQNYLQKRDKLLLTPGGSFHFEQRRRHKNGNWIWCEGSVTNYLNEPGINALLSNFRDVSEKKTKENEHDFDRSNLNALINNTADLMWSVDKNFNLITSNLPFDEMGKANFGKIIPKGGNVLSASYTPEMLKHFKLLYERAFAGEAFTETEHFDYPFEMWSEISYYPIRKGDEVIGTACHSRDITERKQHELLISESEVRLAEAQAISKVGNWEVDLLTLNLKWSAETFKIFELNPEDFELTYLAFMQFVYPDDRAKVETAFKGSFNTEGITAIEHRILTAKGNTRIIEERWKVWRDDQGLPKRVLGTSHDITERKMAEEQRRQSKAQLIEAQRVAKMGNWNFDIKTNSLTWSEELYHIFDIDRETFRLNYGSFLRLVDEVDRERASLTSEHTRQTGEPFIIEYHITTLKGEKRIIQERGFGEKDNNGLVLRLFGTAQDITQSKRAEENLERRNEELLKTNTELDRFVYSTSHDLRAPLASLLGLIEMVSEDIEPSRTLQIEHMAMMKQSVLKLDNFIEDILNYSRNARTEIAEEAIVFEDMIQEVRREHKFMEGTAKFKLKVEITQTGEFISDKRRINVILNNLTSNAVKYQDTTKEKSFVHIAVKADEKMATIIVEDNGIGIAEKDKEKIFEMFYRASKQSTGSGLGLYIVKETLDKLGATIILESQKSIGSKFKVTIPNSLNHESKNHPVN